MGEDLLTQVCLRVLGGLGGAEFAGFIGIFRMGEDLLTQVRSYERWTRVCERCMRDCERLRAFTSASRIVWKQDLQDFFWIFRMGEDLLTQVRSYERWTRDGERLREIMSVCECLCVWGGLSEAGFAGFIGVYWDFQDGGGPADAGALVRTLVESLRAFTRDHECFRVFTCFGWVG